MSGPRIGSLFSGTGGLDMGVQAVVGGDLAWVADIDPGASAILSHHHPDVPNLGDITAVDWRRHRGVDVITAGYPCQPFSSAGKQRGTDDERHLWPDVAVAISILRPGTVVLENVRNHLRLGFDVVLQDLASLDYDVRWTLIPASEIGAPHERMRLFIVARPAGWISPPAGALFGTPLPLSHGAKLPHSGVMIDGHVWKEARPSFGQVAPLLPTPTVSDTNGAGAHGDGGLDLRTAVSLLPTPRASDGEKGGPNQRGSSGDLMLPSAVALLPTPAVNDMGEGKTVEDWDAWTLRIKAEHGNGNEHGKSLSIEAQRLLPTPTTADSKASGAHGYSGNEFCALTDATVRQPDRWGEYAAAIYRWESLFRPAPEPTQPSSKGKPQLAPAFVEWMMGLPAGHVTDPGIYADMTDRRGKPLSASAIRNLQLRALGNGVVPQQATAAVRWGLAHAHLEVSA